MPLIFSIQRATSFDLDAEKCVRSFPDSFLHRVGQELVEDFPGDRLARDQLSLGENSVREFTLFFVCCVNLDTVAVNSTVEIVVAEVK